MRQLSLLPLLFLAALACRDESVKPEKDSEPAEEVPADIVPSKLCSTLFSNIIAMFPEAKNNQQRYLALFSDTVQQQIVLTKESEVYVSFVAEGATIASTLGWYTYNETSPPGSRSDVELNLLFPHVSGDVLKQGDTRKLGEGKFKAGTVIGFFLIVGGWQDGIVTYKKPTLFTDQAWNTGMARQHVLFKEKQCGDVVIGFEDKQITLGTDADFNDIIFTVSDNNTELETVSFDLKNVVIM
ncbi:MAG: DUF4114 domain-containing protein [Bacteroidota bacterium]